MKKVRPAYSEPPVKRQKKYKKGRTRRKNATKLTLSAIMLFEFCACVLLALRPTPSSDAYLYAAGLAVFLPAVAWLSVTIAAKKLCADAMLVMLMNFLCGLGVILLFGLSPDRGVRHALIFIIGWAMFVICLLAVRGINDWRALCFLMIPAGIILLLLPVAIGQVRNGAKSWITLPFSQSFQTSELVKILLLLVLSQYFSTLRKLKNMLPGLLFAIGCLGALMLQMDMGTALLYYMVTLLMYWAASSNLPVTLAGVAGGAGAAYLGYTMFSHVKVRIAIWRNPWLDATGNGYQIVRALMAIASGGLFGRGLGMSQPKAIPAESTDFIFAVLCEQFGILFGVCVLGLYVIVIFRGMAISLTSRTSFHALLALGCTLFIGLQTFTIIGGVVKLIPLTGVTMPFVSYGGTSLVSCMGMMGMLCGVAARNERDREQDRRLARGAEAYQ